MNAPDLRVLAAAIATGGQLDRSTASRAAQQLRDYADLLDVVGRPGIAQDCRGCEARIDWKRSPEGRPMPVQRVTKLYGVQGDLLDEAGEQLHVAGQASPGTFLYVNHFQTCPKAHLFSKRQRRGS